MHIFKKLFGLLAVAWASGQVAAMAQNPESLPVIPGNLTYPVDINNSGDIIGVTYDANFNVSAVRWVNGSVAVLPGFASSIATGLNDAGVVVGASFGPEGESEPVVWADGKPQTLPTLGRGGMAYDINNKGDIVGWVNTELFTAPALWRNGQLIVLSTLAENGGEARAIDNEGRITGFSRSLDYTTQLPTQWVDGVVSGLPVSFDENYLGVLGITKSNGGKAAGYLVQKEFLEDGTPYIVNLGVAWVDGEFRVLQRPSGRGNSVAYGVNANGVIFGYTTDAIGYATPTLWDQDGAVRLPFEEGRSAIAVAANESGLVVGVDNTNGRDPIPVLWRVPSLNRIQMTSVQTSSGKSITLVATVTRAGQPSPNRSMEFQVNNKTVGRATTNTKGVATMTYKVASAAKRRLDIMASLGGSNYLFRNLVVGRSASRAAVTPAQGQSGQMIKMVVSLRSEDLNRPIANAPVTLLVGGRSVATGKTSAQGLAQFNVKVPKSNNLMSTPVEVRYAGDSKNLAASGKATLTVKP